MKTELLQSIGKAGEIERLIMKTELLQAIGKAGETAGYWTVYTRKGYENHARIDVRDAQGREFFLRHGGYDAPGKIVCDTVDPEDRTQGLKVIVDADRAGISDKKSPDVIAKEAYRRVVGHPEVTAAVDAARAKLAALQQKRAEFRALVQGLRAQGWHVSQERDGEDWLPRGEVYSVRMYRAGVPAIDVRDDGKFEFVYSPAFELCNLGAVVALRPDA